MKPLPVDFAVYAAAYNKKASAMTYYRMLVPLKALHKRGLANVFFDDGVDEREEAHRCLSAADIAVFWNPPVNHGAYEVAERFRAMTPVMKDGALLTPPAYLMDVDDGLEYTSPLNPSYVVYGIRNWKGELLSPGDSITIPGSNGEERPFYVDKKSFRNGVVWDIERNRATLSRHYEIARMARGMVVSTPALADLYRANGVENVYIYPNSVFLDDHYFPTLAPHSGVRILWQGGDSHFADLLTIREILTQVIKENPQTKLVIWGQAFPWITREIPPEQLEVIGWDDYNAYKIKRACLGIDINLCPVEPTIFNECKSAIKWYEGSLGQHPECTIAANFGPYKEIEDGVTGLLYNDAQEFGEKLRAAIKSSVLRQTLAQHAKDWVCTNRNAEKTIVGYYEFMEDIKRKQRMEALRV